MNILFLITGIILGSITTWAIVTNKLKQQKNNIDTQLKIEQQKNQDLNTLVQQQTKNIEQQRTENTNLNKLVSELQTELNLAKERLEEFKLNVQEALATNTRQQEKINTIEKEKANLSALLSTYQKNIAELKTTADELKNTLQEQTNNLNHINQQRAELYATNQTLREKLETQKTEIETLRKQFNTEFENIANKILEEKTAKFTQLNQDNLANILKPLGENLDNFKKKVEEVYEKEAKERFSLGKEVQKLVELNQKISEEANNLTNALKGNSKIQGDWGQMILENILEKSGLIKNSEYFVQEYLKDDDGNYLKNEDGTKMQPDIIIKYPDNRKVIIDAKVSLTAYTRYTEANNKEETDKAIDEHLKSIKRHVDELSRKNYQDFAPSLDFVMMFIPNEPAYLLALQSDQDLWHYAYNKRILLISPTNLIAALKLIVDLWKREYQNKNAQDIAERGAILYDKFVNFVENLKDIGTKLDAAQKSYNNALGQLVEGRGNLIGQAEKLRELGIKNKKNLPQNLFTETDTTEK